MSGSDGDMQHRALALTVIQKRGQLRTGEVSDAEYDAMLDDVSYSAQDPRGVRLLDALALIAVELVDTLQACLDVVYGKGLGSTEDIFRVYLDDFGLPYT